MTFGKSDAQAVGELHFLDQQLEVRYKNQWQPSTAENKKS